LVTIPTRHVAVKRPHWAYRTETPIFLLSKPDIPSDDRWRIPMKNMILAAIAALGLVTAVVPVAANAAIFHNGSTVAGDDAATRQQQTGSFSE
jgi:hypothetical protein